ncbi:MAG: carbohydrate-binding family 9-like protein [Lentisphaerota bacterium]
MSPAANPFVPHIYHCRRAAAVVVSQYAFADDAVWNEAESLWPFFRLPENDQEWMKPRDPAVEQTRVKMLWNSSSIYLTAELDSTELFVQPDAPTWESDVLEIFLQPSANSNAYYEFHATCDGRTWSARFAGNGGQGRKVFESGLQCKAEASSSGSWRVNMRLPLKTFNIQPPQSGDEWRFNLARQNYGLSFKYDACLRGDAVRGRELSSSAARISGEMAFHDCTHFDVLKFL